MSTTFLAAGDMRSMVYIEQPTANQGADGQDSQVWSTFAPSWAQIKTTTGKTLALQKANTITATATHVVTIPYIAGITQSMRIRYGEYVDFSTLSDERFALLDDLEFAALVGEAPEPRIFRINFLDNVLEQNVQIQLTCTEVLG